MEENKEQTKTPAGGAEDPKLSDGQLDKVAGGELGEVYQYTDWPSTPQILAPLTKKQVSH